MTGTTAICDTPADPADATARSTGSPVPWAPPLAGPAARGGWLRRDAHVIGLVVVALLLGFGAGLMAQNPTESSAYRELVKERDTLSAANEHLDDRIDALERELRTLREASRAR